MIKICNVSKNYGSFHALKSIDLIIPKNQVTAIIGENGSGKTTLLNVLSRFHKCDSGEIMVDDYLIESYEASKFAKKVATLRQMNHFNLRLRVKELVAFGRYPHNQGRLTKNDYEIINKSMELMKCTQIENQYIDTLSGGQLQRASISMILAQDTEIILLDEPLNNLDLKHAHELMAIIQRYAHECCKTVVIILHDINMVYQYCDNVIALKEGEVICDGPVGPTLTSERLSNVYSLNFSVIHNQKQILAFVE